MANKTRPSNLPLSKPAEFKTVGHRGWPECYPENSWLGCEAALERGLDAVEIDIQFAADGHAYVVHDLNLERVAESGNSQNYPLDLSQLSAEQLQRISVHEPRRFGEQFKPLALMRLQEFVERFARLRLGFLFVEIKAESFAQFDREYVGQYTANCLQLLGAKAVVISFDWPMLKLYQTLQGQNASNQNTADNQPLGWVLSDYSQQSLEQAKELNCEFLICNHKRVPASCEQLWPGAWQWFIYDVVTQPVLQRCLKLGATWIETWDADALLALRTQI